jgi:hypothetical protein
MPRRKKSCYEKHRNTNTPNYNEQGSQPLCGLVSSVVTLDPKICQTVTLKTKQRTFSLTPTCNEVQLAIDRLAIERAEKQTGQTGIKEVHHHEESLGDRKQNGFFAILCPTSEHHDLANESNAT